MTAAVTSTSIVQNNTQNTSPQNSIKAPPKTQNKPAKSELVILHKEFFEEKANHPVSQTQKLAACILKMSPNQSHEAKEEYLTNLKEIITNYDSMGEHLQTLNTEITKLRDENLQITQKANDQIPINFQIPNFLEHFFDKDFFRDRTVSTSEKIQNLALCLVEQPFTLETQNKLLNTLRNTIVDYESMSEELQNLSKEISELRVEKQNAYQNPIIEYTQNYSIETEELVLTPKKARKQLLKLLQELVGETSTFYDTLEYQHKALLAEKKDFSASMCLSSQKQWDKPTEQLSSQKILLTKQGEATQNHLSTMKKEIEEIEKKLAEDKSLVVDDQKKKERQKITMPTIASLSLTYLDTKRLSDGLAFYYSLAQSQIKAAEWKLAYIFLVDTAFAEITQLAIEIGAFRVEVDTLKIQLQKQPVGVENTLKSVIVPKYNELADRTKTSYAQIKALRQGLENKEQKETLFIYDNQTRLILSQEGEKIQALIQLEQHEAYDKIKTVWETVEEGMAPESKIPSLANRFLLHTTKSLPYEINRLYTAAKEKYASLPLDSTEGRLWTLQKIVASPFQ